MRSHPTSRPIIADRPFRWVLVGAIALAPLAACISADGAFSPEECEKPPVVSVDTTIPSDSVRPTPPTSPQPGAPVCKPDNV